MTKPKTKINPTVGLYLAKVENTFWEVYMHWNETTSDLPKTIEVILPRINKEHSVTLLSEPRIHRPEHPKLQATMIRFTYTSKQFKLVYEIQIREEA